MNTLTGILVLALVAIAASSVIPEDWQGRIVGGTNAIAGQIPHQASLRSNLNAHFCGASILNDRWLVSAAHCTVDRTLANTRVVVNTIFLLTGGYSHIPSVIRNHPNFNAVTLANDISVIQTAGPMTFNANVKAIALASGAVGGGVDATVSGWGQLSEPGPFPNTLQYFNTKTITNAVCSSQQPNIFDSSICTFTRSGQGNCKADSGGPLTVGTNLVAVVSWGTPCGVGKPDVYVRIAYFRSWLLAQIL